MKSHLPISFIIPAFNCAGTLVESVRSIIDSNLSRSDEIVIVNDGSTDNTAIVLERLERDYEFVHVVNHRRNKGGGAARNTAVENTQNDILFCLDSDNLLAPGSIGPLIDYMQESRADSACFQELHFFQGNPRQITHVWKFRPGEFTLADHLAGNVVPGASGNYIFTKESWARAGGYPEFAGALDTWGFGLRQLASGSKLMVMPDTYYLHRWGHDSYWIRDSSNLPNSLKALQVIIPFLHLLEEEEVDYIFSKEGREVWLDLLKRPLRLKSGKIGQKGTIIPHRKSLLFRLFLKRAIVRLTNIYKSNRVSF